MTVCSKYFLHFIINRYSRYTISEERLMGWPCLSVHIITVPLLDLIVARKWVPLLEKVFFRSSGIQELLLLCNKEPIITVQKKDLRVLLEDIVDQQ